MKRLIAIAILFLVLYSCDEKHEGEIVYLKNQKLDYGINAYKVKINGSNYFVLINEDDFYYFVNNLSLVKNRQEYFSKREEFKKEPIEIDSVTFSNYISKIVYPDSCNNKIVNDWVSTIENEPNRFLQALVVDSTVSQINVNCIYYRLLNDSFKIYQEDVSGDYILSN